jgi:hypothetical protein
MIQPSIAASLAIPKQLSLNESNKFLVKLANQLPDEKYIIIETLQEGMFVAEYGEFKTNKLISIWRADINNDGLVDYALIIHGEGSGHYDYFEAYIMDKKGVLHEPSFILQNKMYPSNVSAPPIVFENGKTYVILENIWSEDKSGKSVYAGANSNAAKNAYFLLREEHKYLIEGESKKLISKKRVKSKLEE